MSRTQERLLHRLAQVRGETRRYARVDDVDWGVHHPGKDHARHLLTRVGDAEPADTFGVEDDDRCPGCDDREVPEHIEAPALAEEVPR